MVYRAETDFSEGKDLDTQQPYRRLGEFLTHMPPPLIPFRYEHQQTTSTKRPIALVSDPIIQN